MGRHGDKVTYVLRLTFGSRFSDSWANTEVRPYEVLGFIVHGSAVEWTADAASAPVQYMGVDHGGFDILVTKQFLDRPNVVAIFQQMRGEGVAEGMTTANFLNLCPRDGCFDGALNTIF